MTFTFTFNKPDQFLLFTHEGDLNDASINDFLQNGIQTVIDSRCYRLINDYRKVTLNLSASKIIEIQQTIMDGFSARGVDPRNVKRALVVSEAMKNFSYFKIFETINLNRGLRVKLFLNMDQAVQWIKAQ